MRRRAKIGRNDPNYIKREDSTIIIEPNNKYHTARKIEVGNNFYRTYLAAHSHTPVLSLALIDAGCCVVVSRIQQTAIRCCVS